MLLKILIGYLYKILKARIPIIILIIIAGFLALSSVTLLWSQCSSAERNSYKYNNKKQQNGRQPLMTKRNNGINELGEYFGLNNKDSQKADSQVDNEEDEDVGIIQLTEIPCNINGKESIKCLRSDAEIYVPFSFLHDYFEVYGHLSESSNTPIFFWSHSNSHVFEPTGKYNPFGPFLNFEAFNVEARERVKCISAMEGVPISTQWLPAGYTYPTQIAQFGLAHYSKYMKEPKPKRLVLEDGFSMTKSWFNDESLSSIEPIFDKESQSTVLNFKTFDNLEKSGISMDLSDMAVPNYLILSFNLWLPCKVNSSITITLQTFEKKSHIFYLHYICSNSFIVAQGDHIYYGLGFKRQWTVVTRNLVVDLLKGVALGTSSHPKKLRKSISKSKIHLLSIDLMGEGKIDNITLSNAEHLHHVFDAANWLLRHQDKYGGWAVSVPRKMIPGVLEAAPGWYSAMAQGQAISLFVRAAHISHDRRYLQAAAKATKLYFVNSTAGGVRTYFPGGYVWYEEYPTMPSSFVLNGFMYSLFGLYDLMQAKTAPKNPSVDLFDSGMKSLKALLPFFDSGSGSFYDLRHFTAHVEPKIARWDYHTTHITELLFLASITDDSEILVKIADRWKEYMTGRKAAHN